MLLPSQLEKQPEVLMKKVLLTVLTCFVLGPAFAQSKAFQASLTPEIAKQPRFMLIEGLSLNVWGENEQHAIALGLVNGSVGDSAGASLGILNYAENYKGIHLGLINSASGQFSGVQCGWLLGFSAVNYASALTGLQLGLVNYADTAKNGLQLGVINIMADTKTWFGNLPQNLAPGMIILNWSF